MPIRAEGSKKNLVLTIWLCLPFLVVGSLIAGIFFAYSKGPTMDARPIGQGAGDTGGANALGEWLAGNDPGELDRIARGLREGRLVDPIDWPDGVAFTLSADPSAHRYLFSWDGQSEPILIVECKPGESNTVTLDALAISGIFAKGLPGAGFYTTSTTHVRTRGSVIEVANGDRARRVLIQPVAQEEVTEGEMIGIKISSEND